MLLIGALGAFIFSLCFLISLVAIIRPFPKIKLLETRAKGARALLISIILWFVSMVIIGAYIEQPVTSPPTPQPTKSVAQQEKPLNNSIEIDGVLYTITELKTPNAVGLSDEKAGEGGILVAVIVNSKNVGTEPVKASAIKDNVRLIDENSVEYRPDSGKSSLYRFGREDLNRKIISDLNPDISSKDAFVFEVSKTKFNQEKWHATIDGAALSLPLKK